MVLIHQLSKLMLQPLSMVLRIVSLSFTSQRFVTKAKREKAHVDNIIDIALNRTVLENIKLISTNTVESRARNVGISHGGRQSDFRLLCDWGGRRASRRFRVTVGSSWINSELALGGSRQSGRGWEWWFCGMSINGT